MPGLLKLRYLTRAALIIAMPVYSMDLLEEAISKGDATGVESLLQSGQIDKHGIDYALRVAIEKGRKDERVHAIFGSLLAYSIEDFSEILHRVAYGNSFQGLYSISEISIPANQKVLELLIQHGIKMGKIKQDTLDDLLIEVARGKSHGLRRASIEILLKYKADINKRRDDTEILPSFTWFSKITTPLTGAILTSAYHSSPPRTVKFLLEKGAEITIPDTNFSAYDYTGDGERWKPVRVVLDNHRRKLSMRYAVHQHLTRDTTGIVVQYVGENYPLMKEWPLASFELVDDGCGADRDDE